MIDRTLTPGTKPTPTSKESRTVEFVWLCTGAFCSEIYLYDAGRCVECDHPLHKRPAWRRTHGTCEPLVRGWYEAIKSMETSDMDAKLTAQRRVIDFERKLMSWAARGSLKASEQRHGAAQDFVSFDPQGGVWIDMARYLRSPAGQAQLQALGGKKAVDQRAIDANALADAHRMYEAEHGHPFSESEEDQRG